MHLVNNIDGSELKKKAAISLITLEFVDKVNHEEYLQAS